MIRLKDIQSAFYRLVGWENGYGANEIDPLYESVESVKGYPYGVPIGADIESGLTVQGAHPLLTLQNIRSVMPEDWNEQYPEFGERTYFPGERISYKGRFYICRNETTQSPEDYPENWSIWFPLTDFLETLMIRSIGKVVQAFLTQKQLNKETKTLLERRTLFDGAARMQAFIEPRGKLVGFEVVPVRALGVTTKIERIGLQMIGATGSVYIYIFHSSQREPVYRLHFNYTNTSGGFQWFKPASDIYLPYLGDNTDAGGAWFICYLQDELPEGMRALNVSKDWSAEPCQTCLGGSIESWRQLTKYLQVSPFAATPEADFISSPVIPDIGKLAYTNTMNYGMNLEVSVGCDLSDFLIQQRGVFARVLQLQMAADILRMMAMNPDVRVNRNQMNVTRDEILYEVDGNPTGRASGLGYELKQAYKALEIDTKGLDRICLTCNNGGVKYRTV